jgi:hypothetical protein
MPSSSTTGCPVCPHGCGRYAAVVRNRAQPCCTRSQGTSRPPHRAPYFGLPASHSQAAHCRLAVRRETNAIRGDTTAITAAMNAATIGDAKLAIQRNIGGSDAPMRCVPPRARVAEPVASATAPTAPAATPCAASRSSPSQEPLDSCNCCCCCCCCCSCCCCCCQRRPALTRGACQTGGGRDSSSLNTLSGFFCRHHAQVRNNPHPVPSLQWRRACLMPAWDPRVPRTN